MPTNDPISAGTTRAPRSDRRARRVLFVCIENANRSQMAEAFARMLGGGRIEAWSAGSRPARAVHPAALEAMREVGCDLSSHRPKGLDGIPPGPYDAVVSMGCGDACPHVPAHRREEWQIPDPKDLPPGEFRRIRDLIRVRVRELVDGL